MTRSRSSPRIPRRVGFLLCLSIIAVSATVLGQAGASLSLTVLDERGRPIESAAVILRPELQVPGDLPPPFFTDAKGQVLIEGLMEGE